MNTKHKVGILVFLCGISVVMTAHAILSMSESVIRKGTTLEVLEPGPDLQALIGELVVERDGLGMPDKEYLIKLGPGVYTITANIDGNGLFMVPFISIMGSGQEVTTLTGAITGVGGADSSIVIGADNAALTDLTVENTGASGIAVAISNFTASPRIQNVTAIASGAATTNVGINNIGSSPTMSNVTAIASNATTTNFGVGNNESVLFVPSSPAMNNVVAEASGGPGSTNIAVFNDASSPIMNNVTATASGTGIGNGGVVSQNSSSPIMNNVTAKASGGAMDNAGLSSDNSSPIIRNVTAEASGGTNSNNGLVIQNGGSPQVDSSTLSATGTGPAGVNGTTLGTRITDTRIVGGVFDVDTVTTNCLNTFDAALVAVPC